MPLGRASSLGYHDVVEADGSPETARRAAALASGEMEIRITAGGVLAAAKTRQGGSGGTLFERVKLAFG